MEHCPISAPDGKLAKECFDWLDFARAVYTCHKLEMAIKQYASPQILKYIQNIASDRDLFKGMCLITIRGSLWCEVVCSSLFQGEFSAFEVL